MSVAKLVERFWQPWRRRPSCRGVGMDADRRVAREVCSEARVVAEGMAWYGVESIGT